MVGAANATPAVPAPVRNPSATVLQNLSVLIDNNYVETGSTASSDPTPVSFAEISDLIRLLTPADRARLIERILSHSANARRNLKRDIAVRLALGDMVAWKSYCQTLGSSGEVRAALLRFRPALLSMPWEQKSRILDLAWQARASADTAVAEGMELSPRESLDLLLRIIRKPVEVFQKEKAAGSTTYVAFKKAHQMLTAQARADGSQPVSFEAMLGHAKQIQKELSPDSEDTVVLNVGFGDTDLEAMRVDLGTRDPHRETQPPFRIIIKPESIKLRSYAFDEDGEIEITESTLFD